jgi:hypothetical protein
MNRFIGSSPVVTTLSYHNFKIAVTVTHKQLWHSPDKTKSSTVEVPWAKFYDWLTNPWRISFYKLSMDRIENTSSDVLLEGMFIAQLPSNEL